MPRYVWNVLIGFDCFCNSLAGGNPRETFSSRVGRAMRVTITTKWVERVPWPSWLKRHFLATDDRSPQ